MRLSLIFGAAKLNQDLSFPDGLCHRQTGEPLPLPDGWRQHVEMLEEMGLPPPRNIHSLDKGVAWVTLLDEVEFDLNTHRVTCRFHNDYLATLPLSPRYAQPLHAIPAAYVQAKRQLVAKHAALVADACRARFTPRQTQPQKKRNKLIKPKKRDRAPSSPCPLIPAPSAIPPPPLPTWFRRATRPIIIDIYRSLVVPYLSQAFWSHGHEYLDEKETTRVGPNYTLWTVRSVIKQLEEKIGHGDVPPPPLVHDTSDESAEGLWTPPSSSLHLVPAKPSTPPPRSPPLPLPMPPAIDPSLRTAYLHFARYIPTLERGAREEAREELKVNAGLSALRGWGADRARKRGSPLAQSEPVRREELPEEQRRCLDAAVCVPIPTTSICPPTPQRPAERARKVALTIQEGGRDIIQEVRRRVGAAPTTTMTAPDSPMKKSEDLHVQVQVWENDDNALSPTSPFPLLLPSPPLPFLHAPVPLPPPVPPRSPSRPTSLPISPPMMMMPRMRVPAGMHGPARHRALERVYSIEVS